MFTAALRKKGGFVVTWYTSGMALVSCPECRTQISDSALMCPKCGHPLGQQRMFKRMAIVSMIIFGIVAVFIFFLFSSLGLIG